MYLSVETTKPKDIYNSLGNFFGMFDLVPHTMVYETGKNASNEIKSGPLQLVSTAGEKKVVT